MRRSGEKAGETASASSAPSARRSPLRAGADDADGADDLLPPLTKEPDDAHCSSEPGNQADGPAELPREEGTTIATDEAFRRRVDALPFAEQLAEIVLEAERRGAEEGQAGVVHLTIWREQAPAVRLFLVPSRVWCQIRTPRPYKTEVDLEFGQPRSRRRGVRKG